MSVKNLRLLHKWVGLIIGLFLFISCLTGIFILIGKLTGSYAPVFRWMKNLHRTLFLDDTGSTIIGISTLLLLVEVVTGYCLWWRIARGQMKVSKKRGISSFTGFCKSLRWTIPNKRWGFHVSGGFWCGLPLILMAVTGLTWSFGWYGSLVYGLFDTDGSGNLFHTIAFLHTGSFWGVWSRIIWLAAATLGASLPITGILIYLKKKTKKIEYR